MNKFFLITISYIVIFIACICLAQDIYVYPNKKLADQGLIEYRRYTLEEARAYQQGGSFEPFSTTAWSAERQLTQNKEPYWPQVINSGNAIFCTYSSMSDGRLNYISSDDAGINWTANLILGDTSGAQAYFFPDICKNNQDLLIISDVYNYNENGRRPAYFKSGNNGITWGAEIPILSYYLLNQTDYISATNIGRDTYVSFNEYEHDSLYVIRSWNFGTNWIGRGVNVAYLSSTPQAMKLRASNSVLNMVWVNEVMPVSVRYSRCADAGLTWSPEIDIAQDSLGSQRCCVSAQEQHVVVSWMGYKYSPYMFTGDMFIRQSFNGGISWDSAQVITDSHKVWMGSCYIKDSLIAVTWQDDRYRNQNYNSEVYVRYSTDYGLTWSQETRLSHGDDDSDSPIATSTNGRLHVLWGDRRPGANGLYYSSNNVHDNIANETMPSRFSQLTSYPNPFNSSTIIKYPANEGGEIGIYNLLGQQVKALRISLNGGQVVWDGTDNQNMSVPSGVYFARLKASGIGIGAKLLLLR